LFLDLIRKENKKTIDVNKLILKESLSGLRDLVPHKPEKRFLKN